MRRQEPQETPDVELRGELCASIVRGFIVLSVAIGLGITSPGGVVRAQDPTASDAADCGSGFSALVAEVLWLRDMDPQGDGSPEAEAPPAEPANGTELNARTRFSLAVVIGDLLLLREQSGTASWPGTLRGLSSQELRRRRDAPTLDGTACEIVRFMRGRYAADRERDGAPLVQRTAREARQLPPAPVARPRPPDPAPSSREATRVVADASPRGLRPASAPQPRAPDPAAPVRPTPPSAAPIDRPLAAPVTPAPPLAAPIDRPPAAPVRPTPPTVASIDRPSAAPARPTPPPPAATIDRPLAVPVVVPPVAPAIVPSERPDPPPADATMPAPAPPVDEVRAADVEPEPSVEPMLDPEVPGSEPPPSADEVAAAKTTLAALELQLAAPRYLTLRVMRRVGESRPDDEVWRSRRKTLEARDELLRLLGELAGQPERHVAVKAQLGPKGCVDLEKRIRELFVGGPDSEKVARALVLWRRQPNPS